ncbi:MAG: hypothetical protein HN981_00230 [Candidatus Pacebacteria bacterium]|jgi:hypothetical protein|nr:hypothetical protein [Candidatus Paceibacterota bacterium]MBT4651981.1 hypothetical protein [Candidatus Paceibacterota bacterium]MBT6756003.1 hypothetical protein [Candidatus Paceibacterota bacterium]MBT6920809.1 hypothetical protein [Candidatus Paceibacterota bacterium]
MEKKKGGRYSKEYQENLDRLRKLLSKDLEIDSHPIPTILEMSPEEATRLVVQGIQKIVSNAKSESIKYHHLGASPYDNKLGKYSTDLKLYIELLEKNTKEFLKKYKKVIRKFELTRQVKDIINIAKEFKGETRYIRDPNASPGRNHHTGRHYY